MYSHPNYRSPVYEHICPVVVRGLQAFAYVFGGTPALPAITHRRPEDCWPAEGGDWEYDLRSTTGRLVPRFQRSLSAQERSVVEAAVKQSLAGALDDDTGETPWE